MSNQPKPHLHDQANTAISKHEGLKRRQMLVAGTAAAASFLLSGGVLAQALRPSLKRVPKQYIAALGDNNARSGNNAQQWGLWPLDPGPRGVDLEDFERLQANGGVAPSRWTFDNEDWWLEEHGLIMEAPEFPLPPGLYQVSGDRETTAILTVHGVASDGTQAWELDNNATIYDVTHLRCRSGRYTPIREGSCTPANAEQLNFPVRSGAAMPDVPGCERLDYAVFIVSAIGVANA